MNFYNLMIFLALNLFLMLFYLSHLEKNIDKSIPFGKLRIKIPLLFSFNPLWPIFRMEYFSLLLLIISIFCQLSAPLALKGCFSFIIILIIFARQSKFIFSTVRLSFALKNPELWNFSINWYIVDFDTLYYLKISRIVLPFW